uniref:Uncharacterized protein n=1 Tax=Salix viminalis TaxID=40686 RepID=A0A6N2LRD1_SALVM
MSDPIQKVNLMKPCCWSAPFKKDDKECGIILLYQTGEIEIRSLPDLQVVGESSLMSILRWNFKTNMEKMICPSENAQIILVNGCEFAAISLLTCENDFRIPESLPCLHDNLLAAAADATISLSPNQKITKGASSGILGGLIKGFPGRKAEHHVDLLEVCKNDYAHLESIFSSPPFSKPSIDLAYEQKVVELSIDDIDIDEPLFIREQKEKDYLKVQVLIHSQSSEQLMKLRLNIGRRMPLLQLHRQRTSSYNVRKNLRGSVSVQRSCKVGPKTLHQWHMNLPSKWRNENGGTYDNLVVLASLKAHY